MHSRFAMDYIYPVPFVLGWLYALSIYLDRRQPRALAIAGLCLGLGFFSYITAIVLMPAYLIATLLVVCGAKAPPRTGATRLPVSPRRCRCSCCGSRCTSACLPTPLRATSSAASNRVGLLDRFGLYWRYFSPSFLFFNGGSQLVFSTRVAGVLLLASLVLLPAGIITVLRRASSMGVLILIGLLLAPLPAIVLDEGSAINRALGLVPFGVLLSAIGFYGADDGAAVVHDPSRPPS